AAYLLDLADKSFRTPEEIRRRLGLPIVGHIPYLPRAAPTVAVAAAGGGEVELDSALHTLHRPTSVEAEAYRSVRTTLYFSPHPRDERPHSQTTQEAATKVTESPPPTMDTDRPPLVPNLAVADPHSGRRCLLVAADLRGPRIHRALGLAARVGLAQVIAGTAE